MEKKYPGLGTGLLCTLFGVSLYFILYHFSVISDGLSSFVVIFRPLLIGIVIAYILRKPCGSMQHFFNQKLPGKLKILSTPLALFLGTLALFLIVAALIWFVLPSLTASIIGLVETFPDKFSYAIDYIEGWLTEKIPNIKMNGQLGELLEAQLKSWSNNTLMPLLYSIGASAMNIVKILLDVVIGVIVAMYLLASRERFKRHASLLIQSIIGAKNYVGFSAEVRFADRAFTGFVNGKLLDSLIVGIICFFLCLMIGVPSPVLMATIIGCTNIIPIFGPFIGAIPTSVIILASDPLKAVFFAIMILGLQLFDGYVMGPKILGSSIRISGFWVLVAVTVGGGLFGVIGMIVGVPIFAVLYDIVTKIAKRRLRKMGVLPAMTDEELAAEAAAAEAREREAKAKKKSFLQIVIDGAKWIYVGVRKLVGWIQIGLKKVWAAIIKCCQWLKPRIVKLWKMIVSGIKKAGAGIKKCFETIKNKMQSK